MTRLPRRILRQAPALPAPDAPALRGPPGRPAAVPGLIGRAAPLARLGTALSGAATGRGRCVLVQGEAGIGKSTLAAGLIDAALSEGLAVAYGSPHDSTGSLAFRPWLQALDAITAIDPAARAALSSDATPDGAAAPRERRFAAVAAALRAAAARQPLMVLLDDLHDADAGSAKLLLHVARQL